MFSEDYDDTVFLHDLEFFLFHAVNIMSDFLIDMGHGYLLLNYNTNFILWRFCIYRDSSMIGIVLVKPIGYIGSTAKFIINLFKIY
jgi:hypothetical protein